MKHRMAGILIFIIIGFMFQAPARAMDWKYKKPEYMGTAISYARETEIIFRHSDCVDYDSWQFRLFTGRNINSSWRSENGLLFAHIEENCPKKKQDGLLYGVQTAILYDFLRFERVTFFAGVSAGIGYLSPTSGYDELADTNPFGLFEGRLGIDYKMDNNFFLRVQGGIFHISAAFKSDQGHNYWSHSLQFGYHFK